jgi:hypothetical protein
MRFILDEYKNSVKFEQQKDTMRLIIQNKFDSPESLMEFLIKFVKKIIDLYKTKIFN